MTGDLANQKIKEWFQKLNLDQLNLVKVVEKLKKHKKAELTVREKKIIKIENKLAETQSQLLKAQNKNQQENLKNDTQRNTREETIQKLTTENKNYKNEISELKAQLSNQTSSSLAISELEQEKEELLRQLESERVEKEKLEQEKTQSKLVSDDNAKEVETLQKKITENISYINSLDQKIHDSDES